MSKPRLKYITETVTIANGTAAGVVKEFPITTDNEFDKVTGYAVHIISRGANENFRIGLTDRSGIIHDKTFENDHITSTSVNPNERYKKIDAQAGGQKITVQVENIDALTADMILDIVLREEKEDC